jgi:cell division protein FtsA
MSSEDPLGIVELGNINIKCLIFKIKNDTTEILSTSISPIDGIKKDVVINLSKASNAIRFCVSAAEKKANVSLKKINVVFEQPDFLCTKFSKHKKINGSKIHKDDIEFLLIEAKKQFLLNDKKQSIIHIFNHNYIVDGKTFIEEPMNIFADTLSHEMTFISAPKNNLKNIYQAFIDCDLEIERLISRTFVLGTKIINYKDLQLGSALINLGFESTSLGLFKNLALVNSFTLPFGTNHIIKDISKVCSLDLNESEVIKNDIDYSFKDNQNIFDENNYLKKNYFINSTFRKISKDLITKVIKARLDEIFDIIKKQLIIPGFSLDSKFILFGDGSNLLNLEKYINDFFAVNIKKMDNNLSQDEYLNKNFLPSLGALKIIQDGWETEALPKKNDKSIKKISFFNKIFRGY